jgi:hypothetical protein
VQLRCDEPRSAGASGQSTHIERLRRHAGQPTVVCSKCDGLVSPPEHLIEHFTRCSDNRRPSVLRPSGPPARSYKGAYASWVTESPAPAGRPTSSSQNGESSERPTLPPGGDFQIHQRDRPMPHRLISSRQFCFFQSTSHISVRSRKLVYHEEERIRMFRAACVTFRERPSPGKLF